jgi:multicomponent Na+:H+ antiporter subunit E
VTRLVRHPGLVLWLTVVWVGLWGSATPANVLGGLAVALVLVLALPLQEVPGRGQLKVLPLLRFVGFFAMDLVRASIQVALLVVLPRRSLRQAVVAVPVRGASDRLLTLLANAISLTPGTLTLEVDRPRSTLYVHVLNVGAGPGAVERVRSDILRLERLAILAVGSERCRVALAEDLQERTEVPQ